SKWLGKVILFSPCRKNANSCPALTSSEYAFVNRGVSPGQTWNPSAHGCFNLTQTKLAVASFLASGAFSNSERFLPAWFASADPNSRISDSGDDILKRVQPDLESSALLDQLFTVYFGTEGPGGAPPARPPLRVKILSFLSRSVRAATTTERINQLLDKG